MNLNQTQSESQAFQQLHEDIVIFADYYTAEPQILAAGFGFEGIIGVPGLLNESQIDLAVQAGAGIVSSNLNQDPTVPIRNITSAASLIGITATGFGNAVDPFLDAMPIEFSHPLLPSTVDPTDIQITLNTGEIVQPLYAALNPNYDFNERQTLVVFGYFGNRLVPGTPGAVYPVSVQVVADQTPLTVITANGLESAVGLSQTSSNPFVSGPQLVGAKLSKLSLAGDYAPSSLDANLPNHGYAYYANTIDESLYRLRLFTSGGFSPDGVSGFEPGDFERYFILHGTDSQGNAFTITQDQTTYTTSDGVIKVLGLAELGAGLGSGAYYVEDHDNQFDIILAGDVAAISRITSVEIPDYKTTNYSPIYNPGGPGDSPVAGVTYTEPAAPQVLSILNSLDDPMVVSYASQKLADYIVDTDLPVAFRLQDSVTGSHLFTDSSTEANSLVTTGWKFESVPFAVNPQDAFARNVYRLYNPTQGDYLLTASDDERTSATANGYVDQGIAFTAYTEPSFGLEEVYKLLSPSAKDRLYTTSEQERDRLQKSGYQFEGIAFYAPSFKTENDSPTGGFTLTPTSGLITTESGGTATFTVKLTSQPTANVTLNLSSSDPTEGAISTPSLIFTPANFNTAQSITVTGIDDLIVDSNIAYTIITASAISADPVYSELNPTDISVTNQDNDIAQTSTPGSTTVPSGGGNLILGNNTANTIIGNPTNDTIYGYAGDDYIAGQNGADYIDGGIGNDTLLGEAGNDTILGGAGNDTLIGGLGVDNLIGGAGDDVFVYNAIAEGGDNIADFAIAEKFLVSQGGFGGGLLSGILLASQFTSGAGVIAAANATQRFIYDTTSGILRFDADGNGAGTSSIVATLTNKPAIANSNIQVF